MGTFAGAVPAGGQSMNPQAMAHGEGDSRDDLPRLRAHYGSSQESGRVVFCQELHKTCSGAINTGTVYRAEGVGIAIHKDSLHRGVFLRETHLSNFRGGEGAAWYQELVSPGAAEKEGILYRDRCSSLGGVGKVPSTGHIPCGKDSAIGGAQPRINGNGLWAGLVTLRDGTANPGSIKTDTINSWGAAGRDKQVTSGNDKLRGGGGCTGAARHQSQDNTGSPGFILPW
jgi:hypothetical protein